MPTGSVRVDGLVDSGGADAPSDATKTLFVLPPVTKYRPSIRSVRSESVKGSQMQIQPVSSATTSFHP